MAVLVAELVVTTPDGNAVKIPLTGKALVGRHPECEVILADPMASRRHCLVERTPAGTFTVQDNHSANGTLLNGEPLPPSAPVALHDGDTITIGETTLKLQLAEAQSEAEEAKPPAVKLEDDEVALSFIQDAKVKAVSEEEIISQDVNTLKRVAERLRMLVDIGQALGSSLDLPKLLNTCIDKLFEVFPQADRAMIVVYGPDGSLPPMVTQESDLDAALAQRKSGLALDRSRGAGTSVQGALRLSRTVHNQVRSQHQSVLLEKSGSMSLIDIASVMCAPLLAGDNDLGLLYLETRKIHQAFTKEDVGIMTALAGQIAVVVRNSDLAREAAAQAAHRAQLSRFLSPQLVEQMLKGKLTDQLGGTEKKGTIFFSDIVGFTKLAAKMSAQNVMTLLNRYFTVMQNIIFRLGGSIDKCQGDNIMAHWGVLGDVPTPTACAVTAAVEMQNALFAFNRDEAQKKEIALPPIQLAHGIGLNTGILCAGNIGSDQKVEFTVIGDAVNLSARLESIAGRAQTFVGELCWEEIKDVSFCIRMPDCPLKNVEKPKPVYSVRGIIPHGVGTSAPAGDERAIEAMLLSLPCTLNTADSKVAAMVTQIVRHGGQGAKFVLQLERPLPTGSNVALVWDVPEKPSLPSMQGTVERFAEPTIGAGDPGALNGVAAGLQTAMLPGSLVLNVQDLPPEIAEWKPGLLIPSDLKSHEEIVRA